MLRLDLWVDIMVSVSGSILTSRTRLVRLVQMLKTWGRARVNGMFRRRVYLRAGFLLAHMMGSRYRLRDRVNVSQSDVTLDLDSGSGSCGRMHMWA